MKELIQHCDYVKFEAKQKSKLAVELPESERKKTVEECIFVRFVTEQEDEGKEQLVVDKAVKDLIDIAKQIKVKRFLIYPYVHLLYGAKPSSPKTALVIQQKLVKKLNEKFEVEQAPFGWYKEFEMRCKGHPLSELSRIIRAEEKVEAPKKLGKQAAQVSREELGENDHRVIGQQLDLYSFQEVGPGMVFFHPNGWTIRKLLVDYWRKEHAKARYIEINTPIILDKTLWQVSGHWDHYKEHMFFTDIEGRDFAIRPMNCPGAILVYNSRHRSYRELPLRLAELGLVSRNELSGVLSGLFRLRTFTQDDAHLFMNEDQLEKEIEELVKLIGIFYKKFGFEYRVELSTKPEKAMGSKESWEKAESALKKALKKMKVKYKIKKGDGAFYGPKIDFHVKDSLGRSWQLGTVQVDFMMPERFDLNYVDAQSKKKRPVIIHRVIYGSIERFMGILVEHYKGRFPLWLSPVQAIILNMTDKNLKYAGEVKDKLEQAGLRVEADFEPRTIEHKIRDSQLRQINYMIVVGNKEEESKTIAVRDRESGKVKYKVKVDKFIEEIRKVL